MKYKHLLNKVAEYLDASGRKRRKRREDMKIILNRLRTKKRAMKARLKDEKNDLKRKRLKKELDIIHAQRKKGVKALKNAK